MGETRWTDLPPGTLDDAQKERGYSNREASDLVYKTERTWARWRTEDRVPTIAIPAIARVLGLPEILKYFDRPASTHDGVEAGLKELSDRLGELSRQMKSLQRDMRSGHGDDPPPDASDHGDTPPPP